VKAVGNLRLILLSVAQWLSCLPLYTRLAGSNLAEEDEFSRALKIRISTSFGGGGGKAADPKS
jgi:hypothetical protein